MWEDHPVFGYPFLNEGCIVYIPPSKGLVHEIPYSDDKENNTSRKLKGGESLNFEWLVTVFSGFGSIYNISSNGQVNGK